MFLKNQACGSQQNAFSPTLEQRHPKGGLQIAHLLREGGLRNSEAVCGAAEAPNLGHGEENSAGGAAPWDHASSQHILSGPIRKRNQQLDEAFGVDPAERFCFHRRRLSFYSQNL
jgi:hypothetical protein